MANIFFDRPGKLRILSSCPFFTGLDYSIYTAIILICLVKQLYRNIHKLMSLMP
ncbi:hypothetical protein DSUL_20067 [Desulfovibrionales bacterium]